jgi:hypothetical protein
MISTLQLELVNMRRVSVCPAFDFDTRTCIQAVDLRVMISKGCTASGSVSKSLPASFLSRKQALGLLASRHYPLLNNDYNHKSKLRYDERRTQPNADLRPYCTPNTYSVGKDYPSIILHLLLTTSSPELHLQFDPSSLSMGCSLLSRHTRSDPRILPTTRSEFISPM